MKARILILIVAALSSFGCSSKPNESTTTQDGGVAASAMPCEVDAIVAKNCRNCHADPPKFGAPMPLVTSAHLQAKAASDPSKTVAQMVKARIHDQVKPMPASGMLPAADLAVLDGWLDKGSPASSAACTDAGTPAGPKEGPEHLPCPEAERVTFVAHGEGATSKFEVPRDAGNLYECFAFKSPFPSGSVATAFAPIIDDERVVHHWILFETATPQAEGSFGKCKMPLDATFLTGWAPGGGNREMPADVGLKLPGNEKWLILQLHYWNVAGYSDSKDASGVSMCVSKTPRKHTAVISTLGTAAIEIPAKATNVSVTGTCNPELTEPVYVLSSSPHMHGRGRAMTTTLLHGGDPAKSETLVDVKNFDFNAQTSYPLPAPMEVKPGDKLTTTCIYDNPGNVPAYFGEKTEDEMCFNFVLVYPETGLFNTAGKLARRCVGK